MSPAPANPAQPPALRRGAWCMIGDDAVTATLARAGFDWLCLDAQHGAFDRSAVVTALRLADAAWPPLLVRAPSNDAAWIGAALDAGARGVIVPMVSSATEAARAADATHYPPRGSRSWGPMQPLAGIPAPTAQEASSECLVMIETAAGLDAVDEIARTPGVTGLFVGPFDLALALGLALDELLADTSPDSPLRRIAAAAQAAGVTAGAFAGTPERAPVLAAHGFELLAVATDASMLIAGAEAALGSTTTVAGY
ncbi:MAG TPA: aldolase/citrate lyase family protein [Gryllotalpicola sp.]